MVKVVVEATVRVVAEAMEKVVVEATALAVAEVMEKVVVGIPRTLGGWRIETKCIAKNRLTRQIQPTPKTLRVFGSADLRR